MLFRTMNKKRGFPMTADSHYFIAIPIPQAIKEELVEWQGDLKRNLPYKQWTNEEDFHITLKFLGAVKLETVGRLIKELHTIEETTPFSLDLNGIQTFGNPSAPRVLFGNVAVTQALQRLVDLVATSAEKFGFEKEKRAFRSHITLAKKWEKPLSNASVEAFTRKYQNKSHPFTVEHVHLYQIHPTKNPKYEVIESFALKGGGGDRSAD